MPEILIYKRKVGFLLLACPYKREHRNLNNTYINRLGGPHCKKCPYFIEKNNNKRQVTCSYKESTPYDINTQE